MDSLSPVFNGITLMYPQVVLSSPHLKISCVNMSMRPSIIKIIMCNFKDLRVFEDCGSVVDIVIRVWDGRPRHSGRFFAAARYPSVLRKFRSTTRHSFSVHHSRYIGRCTLH